MKTTKANKKAGSAGSKDTAANDKLLSLVRLEPPQTREALADLCTTTTRLTIERDTAQLKLDHQVLNLQEAHGPRIEALDSQVDHNVKLMHLWSLANRETEFGDRQGIEVAGCPLEFRMGTGRLVADVDEETSLEHILALPDSYADEQRALVRIKCTINKQAALAMAKTEEGTAFLKKMGLRVVVDEEFKWTPARTDLKPLPVSGGKTQVKEEAAVYAAA